MLTDKEKTKITFPHPFYQNTLSPDILLRPFRFNPFIFHRCRPLHWKDPWLQQENMAASLPEATDPTFSLIDPREPTSSHASNLQKLPHLTDYLQDLKSYTNPLDNNPFYWPTQGFYISQT